MTLAVVRVEKANHGEKVVAEEEKEAKVVLLVEAEVKVVS